MYSILTPRPFQLFSLWWDWLNFEQDTERQPHNFNINFSFLLRARESKGSVLSTWESNWNSKTSSELQCRSHWPCIRDQSHLDQVCELGENLSSQQPTLRMRNAFAPEPLFSPSPLPLAPLVTATTEINNITRPRNRTRNRAQRTRKNVRRQQSQPGLPIHLCSSQIWMSSEDYAWSFWIWACFSRNSRTNPCKTQPRKERNKNQQRNPQISAA